MNDETLRALADPGFEQYFLVSPEKLSLLFEAADIHPDDRVLEVGAGAGTVARNMPRCKSLTLVELDERLIKILREAVPQARIVQGDALRLIEEIPFDVLIGNLPNTVTESLIDLLPRLSFRTAVLAVGESANLDRLRGKYVVTEVTTITGDDFRPAQPSVSRIVKVTR
ncbi:rRNA adenine N-6-methyltransferase family protein [Amycolatopsis thermoflava]|uniref:rRNA adenine N-6-methyltransferase family protein n=1 Tax=Amycolatopsis thermoflava TaxID=84480 RepID=UPI003F4A1D0D